VLLFAIPQGWESGTAIGLHNLTELHKYDRELRQCIGISFSRQGDDGDERFIAWMHMESAWKRDPELETKLVEAGDLLPKLRVEVTPTYTFRE
jgi:hypothetical protein